MSSSCRHHDPIPRGFAVNAQLEPPMNADVALGRLNNDRSLLIAMAGFFLEDAPQLFEKIRAGTNKTPLNDIVRSAHSIRGLASSFEALPVMQVSGEIEQVMRTADHSQLDHLTAKLDAELARLYSALRALTP